MRLDHLLSKEHLAASLLVVQNYVPDVHAGVVLMGGTLTSRPEDNLRVLVQPSVWGCGTAPGAAGGRRQDIAPCWVLKEQPRVGIVP